MTADDIAPLCHCGGILVRKPRKGILNAPTPPPVDLAVCPRCHRIAGTWDAVIQRCLEERKDAEDHP